MKFRKIRYMVLAVLVALLAPACGGDDKTGNNQTNNLNNENNANNQNNENNQNNQNNENNQNNQNNLSEGIHIPGLSGDVTFKTDPEGIEHVYCDTDLDCVAAQGYIHARDRFAQMDLRRRLARGRLSTLAGSRALNTDIAYRTRLMTRDGEFVEEAWYDRSSQESKDIIDSYTQGVNAWLDDYRNDRNGAELSDEYSIPFLSTDTIADWEVYDTTASAMLLIDDLSNSSGNELRQAEYLIDGTDPEVVYDVLGQISATGTNTIGASGGTYPPQLTAFPFVDRQAWLNAAERVRSYANLTQQAWSNIADAEEWRAPDGFGSNNWVVSSDFGEGTDTAFMANDPHLGLSNPMLWYPIHLDAKSQGSGEMNVWGVSFAGVPGVLIGQNENISWGATVVVYDLADVYVETLTAANDKVLFNGNEVELIEIEHTFEVAGGDDVTRTLRIVPHHGPITAFDPDGNSALSLRWTGHDVDTDFDAFFGLARATNLDEARDAIRNATSTNQNFVVMDDQGNIGWYPYSRVPIRPWASLETPPWLPLDGQGDYEWQGFMDYDDLPQLTNPASGFVATANQDMSGALLDGDPTNDGYNMLQVFPAAGYRHLRIIERLEGLEGSATMEDMVDIQGDHFSGIGFDVVPPVLSLASDLEGMSDEALAVISNLENWNYSCPTGLQGRDINSDAVTDSDELAEAVGCTTFHVLLHHLADEIFSDDIAPAPASRAYKAVPLVLNSPEVFMAERDYFNDQNTQEQETDVEIIGRALDAAGATLDGLGDTPEELAWGRFHAVEFLADLISSTGIDSYDEGPYAAPGGLWTVNVANPRNLTNLGNGGGHFGAGASMRLVSEATPNGIVSKISMPGGVRHFRDSPYYDNFVDGWLNNTPIDVLFDAADVDSSATETTTIQPAP